MRTFRSFVLPSLILLAGATSASAAEKALSYVKDVKPFLSRYCLNCHNNRKAKSGYSVETFASLTKEG
jgi:hypothetical protein